MGFGGQMLFREWVLACVEHFDGVPNAEGLHLAHRIFCGFCLLQTQGLASAQNWQKECVIVG